MSNMKEVVVAVIVRKGNPDKYLLVKSKRDYGKFTGYYYPPSGKVEPGESKIEALKRELDEELSIKITKSHMIAKTGADIKDQVTFWYKCEVDSYNYNIYEDEIVDAGYFTIDDMKSMKIWPETKKFFEKYISAQA